jgi:foldase protein PrsA
MNSKILWSIIIGLVIMNCFTIAYFVSTQEGKIKEVVSISNENASSGENVAKIGDIQISRQQWLSELENRYGKQTLEDMIDKEVIKQMAEKYNISISSENIEQEVTMIKTMYNTFDHETINDEESWREQIELSLLLEELLTKDVDIPEDEMKNYYEENKELYEIPKTYQISHIVVAAVEEAEKVREELANGSSFTALAMEKSQDEFSANQGGLLGYISEDTAYIPEEYFSTIEGLDENEWSQPIEVEGGYAIILLHETINGVSYSFDDVKSQIRRQMAIEQMKGSISVQPFWEEISVSWFYDEKQ